MKIAKRKKKKKKVEIILGSFLFMILAAYLISCPEEGEYCAGSILKNVVHKVGETISINAFDNCSPVAEYALYENTGNFSFPNWETMLISNETGRNRVIRKMLTAKKAVKENMSVVEASLVEKELVIDKSKDIQEPSSEIEVLPDDTYFEPDDEKSESEVVETSMQTSNKLKQNKKIISSLKKSLDLNYLIRNFYIVDRSTNINPDVFRVNKLLKKDCTMKKSKKNPQILIYHTHGGSEAFVDSEPGNIEESVVGMGSVLAKVLSDKYGYNVIHDKTRYDIINGKIDRNKAYNMSYEGVCATLKKYPSIEVLIDLHRDSAGKGKKRITMINGKPTAQIMLFNGLSRGSKGDIQYLHNPNLQSNLSFSLQLKLKSMELYSNLTTKIYLKQYRYNLQMREKAILIELGNNLNTIEEASNAMYPFAEVLNQVLNE